MNEAGVLRDAERKRAYAKGRYGDALLNSLRELSGRYGDALEDTGTLYLIPSASSLPWRTAAIAAAWSLCVESLSVLLSLKIRGHNRKIRWHNA
jgi:hypothetical protein